MKLRGVLLLKRLDVPTIFLSNLSFPGSGKRFLVTLGIVLMPWFFLIGCASQRDMVSEIDYLSMLPEDAEIYLRFPVQENQGIASKLIASLVPKMEERDVEKLQGRFHSIYVAVKDSELSAIATGSFPKVGLSFVLKEKNGWKKVKDDTVPVTGLYYQYQDLPFQIAFPNSSTMMISSQVNVLLTAYNSFEYLPKTNPLAEYSSEYRQGNPALIQNSDENSSQDFFNQTIDFYVDDVISLIVPFLKKNLPIKLPLTDLYGEFSPVDYADLDLSVMNEDAEGRLYSFTGYLGLPDSRAMKPALAALKILFRTLGLNVEYSSFNDDTIKVTGLIVSEKDLVALLNKSLG